MSTASPSFSFPTNSTSSILERLFTSVQNTTVAQSALVHLFDYVEYATKNPAVQKIIEKLELQKADAFKNYYHLKNQARDELKKSKEKLLEIIADYRLDNSELRKITEDLKLFENGSLSMSGNYEHNFDNFLFEICKNISANNRLDLIKQFIDDRKASQNIYGNFTFSSSLYLFKKEAERVEHLKRIEIWHSWYMLKYVPDVTRLTFNDIMHSNFRLSEVETNYYFAFLHLREEVEGKPPRPSTFYNEELSKYKDSLTRLHNYFIQELGNSEPAPLQQLNDYKLNMYPSDGIAEYRSANYQFAVGTKGRVLLDFLNISKNTPLELKYFQAGCNSKIRVEKHKFKKEKDISDTITYIRKALKVNKGEYFPIFKKGNCFIWEER